MPERLIDLFMSEKDLQAAVVEVARNYGWEVWSTWRSDHSPAGEPDLRLCRPPRYVVAELKKQTGKPTPIQRRALALLAKCPGIEAYLWRPSDLDKIYEILAPESVIVGSPYVV